MHLNGEQVDVVRARALQLLKEYVPFKWGDDHCKEVCTFYSKGFGTTCGCLAHWLMWRLGVSEKTILNWTDASRGTEFKTAKNLSKIYNGGKIPFINCMLGNNPLLQGKSPDLGDIVYIHEEPNGPQNTEHVFVFIKEEKRGANTIWKTAEAGQTGGTDAEFKERTVFLPGPGAKLTNRVKVSGNTPNRTIMGWLPLDVLEYTTWPPPS